MRGEPHAMTGIEDLVGAAVVDAVRREESQAAVMVLGVVPREEHVTVRPRVLDRTKARGERGARPRSR